jgi:hypothetical protein
LGGGRKVLIHNASPGQWERAESIAETLFELDWKE